MPVPVRRSAVSSPLHGDVVGAGFKPPSGGRATELERRRMNPGDGERRVVSQVSPRVPSGEVHPEHSGAQCPGRGRRYRECPPARPRSQVTDREQRRFRYGLSK
ncbi:Hypothetical protein SMAX5B_002134 [Scophthalmus maximus]|uniref:Uncharacterized protein n=1 Tax=Scophthalmus maximus TaxID=52904 RepID=A0A2U9AVC0_SCOMX|nr:Hypothetical protein SMAX5B_002134 [Scophthalmus maximus]